MPSTSGNITLNIDGIVTDMNNLSARIEELETFKVKPTLISTRTTTGIWDITNVTVGKPLYIFMSTTGTGGKTAGIRALSGSIVGSGDTTTQSTDYTCYWIGGSNSSSTDVVIFIPTETTVSVYVRQCDSGVTLYAYQ